MFRKRIMAALLALFLTISGGTGVAAYAEEVYTETETNLVLENEKVRSVQMIAGGKTHVSLKIKLKEGSYSRPKFTVTAEQGSPLSFSNVTVENSDDSAGSWVYISDENYVEMEFDITADDFATIGKYRYYISYEISKDDYDAEDGTLLDSIIEPGRLSMEVFIVNEKIPPQISLVSGTDYYAKAGETVTMKFTLENQGELQALDTYVAVDYSDYEKILIPAYTPLNRKVGNMTQGNKKEVTVSYKISEDATTGVMKLPVQVTYKKANGVPGASADSYLYLHIEGKSAETPEALLLLNTVQQSPASPKAGEKMTVSFYLENAGNGDVTNVKVSTPNMSSSGFEPINSEPYQYIGTIAKGEKRQVEITVKVGKDISEGLNTLIVEYSYENGLTETVPIYILDVQNPEDDEMTVSRPKLMVSNFYTDVEEVKAGGVFDFTFELLNTHDSIDAKNIKVTVTGASGTFSVTAGSNSFFVSKIGAREKEPITINLKASAAATTGAYPINIKIEYEYEGMVATSTYSGEIVEEEILLQVKENLRPSVENVYVGSWDTPMINQPTVMNFEFYNMGKSMLNNTYVTVEGDFMLSNGSNSYYIGNIAAGMPEYIEFDVVPLVEGDAVGKMIIHMEDSNGDEVTMEKEFTAFVMGEMMWEDPGYMDPGYMDPGYMDPSMAVDGDVAEKPILPLWAFLCIQGGIMVVVIPVTRAIRLSAYRRKIKKEDAME